MRLIQTLAVCLLMLPHSNVSAEVIFFENYDSISSGTTCSDPLPPGWTGTSACLQTGGQYSGVIESSGGMTGNGLRLWRSNNDGWDDGSVYTGYWNKRLTHDEYANNYRALYVRYYMRINNGFDIIQGSAASFKLARFNGGSDYSSKIEEFYLNIGGSPGSNINESYIMAVATGGGERMYSESTMAELSAADGQWHCYEFFYKMNSTGVSDGEFRFWFDGIEQSICGYDHTRCTVGWSNISVGTSSSDAVTCFFTPGIGNLTDGSFDFPDDDWRSIDFDEYVVSTTYIGPIPPDTTSVIYSGVTIQ